MKRLPGGRRLFTVGLAVAVLGGATVFGAASSATTKATSKATPEAAVKAAASGTTATTGAFHSSEKLVRDNLVDGKDDIVDTQHFSVSVSATTSLRERQELNVSWSGAHPSGEIATDVHLVDAAETEYPVVILECRGTVVQVTPETCWTSNFQERDQGTFGASSYPPYQMDRYDSPAQRRPAVGLPHPVPALCGSAATPPVHWVPFQAASGTTYYYGSNDCAGAPPEATANQSSIEPPQETFAPTDVAGRGSTKFVVSTSETNASLGCSSTVTCSLEIIPIMGISCDSAGVGLPKGQRPAPSQVPAIEAQCNGVGAPAGSLSNGLSYLPVTGLLWWSQSNWKGRIGVPLTFAPFTDTCAESNPSPPVLLYGSELMLQATAQWEPYFCSNPSLFVLDHVASPEPEAKNLLQAGTVDGAIQGEPPSLPFTTPTVQAPIALSGFAIVFDIDNSQGQEVTHLKLDARLLAKLLTESYPVDSSIQAGDPGLSHNPLNIADDPEFQALNPGAEPVNAGNAGNFGEAALATISSQSDAMYALTSYLNADPDARAWLDGQPDPWGMVVNPAYKGIQLPVDQWPLLDTFDKGYDYTSGNNQCLKYDPVPYLPLVASPQASLETVTLNMQFDVSASQLNCVSDGNNDTGANAIKLAAEGPQPLGQAFLIGMVPLGDVSPYDLEVASLQTEVSPSAPSKFTNAAGRTFVAPTDNSLAAAAELLQPQESLGSWTLPYDDFGTGALAAGAYPGTMLMSADIPTEGLSSSTAKDFSSLLSLAATTLQTVGTGVGQLPPGFLPMTAGNGLSAEDAYTLAAAKDVADQSGCVPSLTASAPQVCPATVSIPTTTPPNTTSSSPPTTVVTTTSTAAAPPATQGGGTSGSSGSTSPSSPATGTAAPAPQGTTATTPAAATPASRAKEATGPLHESPAVATAKLPFVGDGVAGVALPVSLGVLLFCGAALSLGYLRRLRPKR